MKKFRGFLIFGCLILLYHYFPILLNFVVPLFSGKFYYGSVFQNEIKSLDRSINSNNNINDNNYTTIVACLFPFKSKHYKSSYDRWMRNMLKSSTKAKLAIFTDAQTHKKILKLKPNLKDSFRAVFYIYDNVWQLLDELEAKRGGMKNYTFIYKHLQHSKDPEKHKHNPNLYAIWNLKSYICSKVVDENPFNSTFFIYSDMGAWRWGKIVQWPSGTFIKTLSEFLNDRILFGQLSFQEIKSESEHQIVNLFIEGTFFAGSKIAIEHFYEEFFRLHDRRLKAGLFVGKDQTLMNLYTVKNRHHVVILQTRGANCSQEYDPYFFYQIFFSKQYPCQKERLTLLTE